jgi:hypothetical protein
MTDCPQCPHLATEHGTYGCLFGWERARYTQSIIPGCFCNERHLRDRSIRTGSSTPAGPTGSPDAQWSRPDPSWKERVHD